MQICSYWWECAFLGTILLHAGMERAVVAVLQYLNADTEVLLLTGSHIAHLSTSDGRIMAGGEQVAFRGVNWPGFETSDWSFLQGLWTDDNLTNDIRTVAWRIRLLGFNTIRIPFSFKVRACNSRRLSSCTARIMYLCSFSTGTTA